MEQTNQMRDEKLLDLIIWFKTSYVDISYIEIISY